MDFSDLPNFYVQLEKKLITAISDTLNETSVRIKREAQYKHRFKTRDGFLQSSITSRKFGRKRLGRIVFLEPRELIKTTKKGKRWNYGALIHEGFKSWQADQFLFDATRNNLNFMKYRLKRKVKLALRFK